jgi:DinB superfamily
MSALEAIRNQIIATRNYSTGLIDTVDPKDWFRMPSEGVTHVGWQVGHLAVAKYRLGLERIRGRLPVDTELLSEEFRKLFSFDSIPDADPSVYPAPSEIRAVFDRTHEAVLAYLNTQDDASLNQPLAEPHRIAKTTGEILTWCAMHEMLHAGQIGLLRRLLGSPPM